MSPATPLSCPRTFDREALARCAQVHVEDSLNWLTTFNMLALVNDEELL